MRNSRSPELPTIAINEKSLRPTFNEKLSGFESAWKQLWVAFVMGPPGAQVEDLCSKLESERGYVHVSMNDAIRKEIASGSNNSKALLEMVTESSTSIPKALILQILKNEIKWSCKRKMRQLDKPKDDATPLAIYLAEEAKKTDKQLAFDRRMLNLRYLISGFPATQAQAAAFADTLCKPQAALYIDVAPDTSLQLYTLNQPLYDTDGNIVKDNVGGLASFRKRWKAKSGLTISLKTLHRF